MARLGLDDATMQEINESLVILHSSMLGQTGPLSSIPGYGNMATALSGFVYTTGWPDREPVGPSGAYTDWLSPRFGLMALLSALHYRQCTGRGVVLDLGQGEAALQLLTIGLLDSQLHERTWERQGNRDYFATPHGVFPTGGDDEWIAIACYTDEQWQALAKELELEQSGLDVAGRRQREDELEAEIVERISARRGPELEQRLQRCGVPAHTVQNSAACSVDAQLDHRGGLVVLAHHGELGSVEVGVPPIRLSRTKAEITRAAPTLGQHNWQVLSGLLGYGDDHIAQLAIAGALE
jgi:crotonobetainyl-CoA:carnitine CoA-transferase CaiB-like acyl-CoA transferase